MKEVIGLVTTSRYIRNRRLHRGNKSTQYYDIHHNLIAITSKESNGWKITNPKVLFYYKELDQLLSSDSLVRQFTNDTDSGYLLHYCYESYLDYSTHKPRTDLAKLVIQKYGLNLTWSDYFWAILD